MCYLGAIERADISKVWIDHGWRCVTRITVTRLKSSRAIGKLQGLLTKATALDFYPVDPASPSFALEVWVVGGAHHHLSVNGCLIMLEDGSSEVDRSGRLEDLLDQLLSGATVHREKVSKFLTRVANPGDQSPQPT